MAILRTYPTSQELAQAAADQFALLAEEAIQDHGRFAVALAGGGTPRPTYETLATIEFAQRVDWQRVHVFWGDERPVPPDHEDSNYRMAYEAMLKYVPIPKGNIHRVPAELKPQKAAHAYQETLQDFFAGEQVRFDLILLGMGTDGHTASLFPGTAAIHEDTRLVTAQQVKEMDSWRITFTPAVINKAANVIFLVSGAEKAQTLHNVLVGHYQPDVWPAQIVRPDPGKLYWFLDAEAAKLL
jgi:6-phosphogluconolactonase